MKSGIRDIPGLFSRMRKTKMYLLTGLLLILMNSCQYDNIPKSGYYWKSKFGFQKEDSRFLKKKDIRKIYVRLFDVLPGENRSGNPLITPQTEIEVSGDLSGMEIVPVFFIVATHFKHSSSTSRLELIDGITNRISAFKGHFPNSIIREVQIDCDWTAGTRKAYFSFLEELSRNLPKGFEEVSVTIRLHQIVNPKEQGIPPVRKGMLMVYNLTSVNQTPSRSAILDTSMLRSYLKRAQPYPLELGCIFPLFSWGLHYNVDGKFIGFIRDVQGFPWNDRSLLEKNRKQTFVVVKGFETEEGKFMEDDVVFLDSVSKQNLHKAMRMTLTSKIFKKKRPAEISYFTLEHLKEKLK